MFLQHMAMLVPRESSASFRRAENGVKQFRKNIVNFPRLARSLSSELDNIPLLLRFPLSTFGHR